MSKVLQIFPFQSVVRRNYIHQHLSQPIGLYSCDVLVTPLQSEREYKCGGPISSSQKQHNTSIHLSLYGMRNTTTSMLLHAKYCDFVFKPKEGHQRLSLQSMRLISTTSTNTNKQNDVTQRSPKTVDGGQPGRSLGKKLLMLWSGALVVIGVVVWLNQKLYIDKSDEAERKKRFERVKDNPTSTMHFLLTIPCMRNSLMLAIISSLSFWVATFLFTSNVLMANKAMLMVPCIIFPSYMAYCLAVTEKDRKESDNIKTALEELQKNKLEKVEDQNSDVVESKSS